MVIDWSEVSAIATVIYGAATLALVIQIWRDRVQRGRHFETDAAQQRLNELRSAFYDAVGYWAGHKPENRSGDSPLDAAQSSKVFEALTRLEGQLRLNGFDDQAHDLGFAVRTITGVDEQLEQIGVTLGLFTSRYFQARAVALKKAT
jgi:hypothetical protein